MNASAPLKHHLEQLRLELQHELNQLHLPAHPQRLYEPIRYFLDLGGKRLRPVLSLLAAELFGAPRSLAMGPALAVELFHNFTLLHDDIMDEAPLRRGKPTVHEKYNRDVAILSGDALMVLAYEQLLKAPANAVPSLLAVMNKVALEVCEGQQYDMDFQSMDEVTTPEYMRMIKLKTSVLLGAALQMGAIVASASEADQARVYEFGVLTGLAFQVQDDLLDVFGDPAKFGKKPGGDILANKNTFLRVKAMEVADEAGVLALQSLYAAPNSEAKVQEITHFFRQWGIRELAEAEMKLLLEQAFEQLNALEGVDEHARQVLRAFAAYLIAREE
ncbi:MAG: isoprenyl synthetase [Sphingobacteriaceae bacterium]|nr:isoprenyl synthetase [Sphingobacteriaceae bacterium]